MNIYKIAQNAGVSVTTVSRVINGKEGVGEETRKKILDIVAQNNFQPRIAKNTFDTIGIFFRSDMPTPISSPYMIKVLDGISNELFNYGYDVMLIPVQKIPKDKDAFKIYCTKRRITGGIFVNLKVDDAYITNYEDVIPIVVVGSQVNSDKIVAVRADNKKGGYEAVKHLIDMGHRNIAFLAPILNVQDHCDRFLGYEQALDQEGISVNRDFVIEYIKYSETGLQMIIDNLFKSSNERCTAAFVCDDVEVIRISSILERIGLSIPNDVSIVGFDDYEYSEHFSPPLTTVRQPIYEVGQRAAQVLIQLINNEDRKLENSIVLDTRLVVRRSVIPFTNGSSIARSQNKNG